MDAVSPKDALSFASNGDINVKDVGYDFRVGFSLLCWDGDVIYADHRQLTAAEATHKLQQTNECPHPACSIFPLPLMQVLGHAVSPKRLFVETCPLAKQRSTVKAIHDNSYLLKLPSWDLPLPLPVQRTLVMMLKWFGCTR